MKKLANDQKKYAKEFTEQFHLAMQKKRGIQEVMRNRIRYAFTIIGEYKTLQATTNLKGDDKFTKPAKVIKVFMENQK